MDKRSQIKTGLSFGAAMTIFFILQNLLTHALTTRNIITSIIFGLISGALSGFLFGWIIGLFANSKFVAKGTKIDTETDENILFETPANHFKGAEAVGGKLYLTNKRLVFKSHKLNIQNHQLTLNLSDIQKVDRYKTMWIADNGLSVTTINGSVDKFVVKQRGKWFDYLTENGLQQKYLQ
jgi:GRAM domain